MNENTVNTQPVQKATKPLLEAVIIDDIIRTYHLYETDPKDCKKKLELSEKLAAYLVDENKSYTDIRIVNEFATDLQKRCKDIQAFRGRHHSAEKDADDMQKKRVKDALKSATA